MASLWTGLVSSRDLIHIHRLSKINYLSSSIAAAVVVGASVALAVAVALVVALGVAVEVASVLSLLCRGSSSLVLEDV